MAMAQVSKDFILSALRGGFSETQIAEALNVTVSAVEQLINSHGLRDLAAKNSKFESIDEKLNSIEEKILEGLEKQVKFISDPMKLTRMLQVVNGSKRRSLAEGRTLQDNSVRLVQLNLPERVIPQVRLNERNEVIEVNERPLLTMQSGRLLQQLEAAKPKEVERVGIKPEDVGKRAGEFL
jgi:predicted transcriptional regulator